MQQLVGCATLAGIRVQSATERGQRIGRQAGKIRIARSGTFQHCHHRLRAEHRRTCGGKRQHRRRGPPVGRLIGIRAIDDLRRDEARRAHNQTSTGHMALVLAHGDAEIDQHRPRGRNHHIGRFDIAVDNASRMHRANRFDKLARETLQIIAHIRAVRSDILLKILALDQLGDNERHRIIQLHVDNAAHTRIMDFLQGQGLATQALACGNILLEIRIARIAHTAVVGQGIAQNLHRIDMAAIIMHPPYRAHGTRSKAGHQRVATHRIAGFKIQRAYFAHGLQSMRWAVLAGMSPGFLSPSSCLRLYATRRSCCGHTAH